MTAVVAPIGLDPGLPQLVVGLDPVKARLTPVLRARAEQLSAEPGTVGAGVVP